MEHTDICCLFGAGTLYGTVTVPQGALVIAADGGLRHLRTLGITPHLTVGDFDSMPAPEGDAGQIVRLNPIKDETDTLWAVRYALTHGCRVFHLYGCTGGRSDHTFANLRLLHMLAEQGAVGYLHGKGDVSVAVCDGSITFHADAKGYLSVFSLTDESIGVYEEGLKYALSAYTMKSTDTVGVSNEFIGQRATVGVEKGVLLLILSDAAYVDTVG